MPSPVIVRQRLRGLVFAGALSGLFAVPALGQRPDAHWRTIATPHFRVHFAPPNEELARRAAGTAEWAYAELARELVQPRGTIELVVSDDADFSNGFTTNFPTNRIVVYAQPPVNVSSLRNYGDWMTLVVTHELTHVFHLDRSRGVWGSLQKIFGRNPFIFPSAYEPRWMSEGIAVYYESRITGGGRIVGSEHRALARASALAGHSLSLGSLSTARTSFPGGESVYIYGSLIFDELAREEGPASVPAFIERSSAGWPFLYNRVARKQFGESFSDLLAAVRDSALGARQAGAALAPLSGWRPLTSGFDDISAPRWRDSSIVFSGDLGRETRGAYSVDLAGRVRRIGRRIGAEPNVPLSGGSLLTAQLEFVGPFEIRSDLYIQRGRRLHRLTHGQRLTAPDARADGEIVAVQAAPGTTTLARVSADGRLVRRLLTASLDTQWAAPRWSPTGDAIAAVRLIRGGHSQIVVLDTTGLVTRLVADEQGSVSAAPAWRGDGRSLVFTSDRTGISEAYVASWMAGDTAIALARVSDAVTALSEPEPARASGSARLAAIWLGGEGMTLGTGEVAAGVPAEADTATRAARLLAAGLLRDGSAVRPYHAARQLLPRYWMPLAYSGDNALVLGATTSASDVVGRHLYSASVAASTRRNEQSGGIGYSWSGLGRPVVELGAAQGWDGVGRVIAPNGDVLGAVRRRTRILQGGLSSTRPRTRTFLAASVAGGIELRDYTSDPSDLLGSLPGTYFRQIHRRPFAALGLAGSNAQAPRRSISLEDGLTATASGVRLWDRDERRGAHTRAVGAIAAYRSLDLGGFAHHVLALRTAGGWTDSEDGTDLSVGGAASDVLGSDGLSLGSSRDFPVRGYASGTLAGTRVLAGSFEYRVPLVMPASGIGVLYVDRTSLGVFADAASAWCGGPARSAGNCATGSTPGTPIASVGAEVVFRLALAYDAPFAIGVGFAKPIGRLSRSEAAAPGVYVSLDRSF